MRDDDSNSSSIVNDSDDKNMGNSIELDAFQGSLDDKIQLQSNSSDNAFEMNENNYSGWFFRESENNNA